MTYRIRVSLPGIKGFARVYEMGAKTTLYAFHKQMLSDMEFPQDQIVLFKAFDKAENVVARYATFDLGCGSIEHISIKQAVDAGITHFVYFYDTTNKKSVILTIEGEGNSESVKPTLLESKGPIPEDFLNGYVAFEDLPPEKRKNPDDEDTGEDEDDDEEDDEEDDGDDGLDEDFEEKYDDTYEG